MSSKPRSLVFVGLPGTGKSTYLALLYLAIWGGGSALKLGSVQDDRRYINELSGRLLRCEPQDHTSFGNLEGLSLSVVHDGGDELLQVPDLSGENWQQALVDRNLADPVVGQLRSADGVCLFLNVGDVHDDPTLDDAARAAAALGAEVAAPGENAEFADANLRATQVQLVDLLQVLDRLRLNDPPRLSLILSAFDLANGDSPKQWLDMNLPLLSQYLTANQHWLPWRLFGVSAQGGDFGDDDAKKDLVAQKAVARASVVAADGAPLSIDSPALWAMGILEST